MAHIQYSRLTHLDAEKDRQSKGPTKEEHHQNRKNLVIAGEIGQLVVCLQFDHKASDPLGNGFAPILAPKSTFARLAAKSRARGNSRVVLGVAPTDNASKSVEWPIGKDFVPSHKKICGGSTSSTDLTLKLTKKLLVNEYLMFYLQVYNAIALELLSAPENALETCLLINVVTKDADPLAAIESIEKHPLAVQTTPGMRLALEKARAGLADTPLQGAPVVLLVFTGDATNCIGFPCPIDPEALKQARERNPFVVKSAMLGVREVPVTEESILECVFCSIS
ncbi:hypothetical protein FB451DRAFT_1391096 [Mycena latifolia]|nr:hypothetical protein FB451DRAFT_1391096 [Mycena latifolia]